MNDIRTAHERSARTEGARPRSRRAFFATVGGEALGAAAIVAGIAGSERAGASAARSARAAEVFIAKSANDQEPHQVVESPLYFMNGDLAGGFHTLDVSTWRMSGVVTGTVTSGGDTIIPDFSSSVAAAMTHGSDGELYFVVAAEGSVTGGKGVFDNVTKAIFRGKYRATVDPTGNPLLQACADCVIVLMRE